MKTILPTLKQLAEKHGYEIRSYKTPLKKEEEFKKIIRPFNFSEQFGGTIDSFKYYNKFYLYPIN